MKKIILITIFSLLLLPVKAQWHEIYTAPNSLGFREMFTINKDTLFIVAFDTSNSNTYYLKRTYDGGITWTDYSYNNEIKKLQFANNTGYMLVGNDIVKTIDFGDNWQTVYSFQSTNERLMDLYVINENTVIQKRDFINNNNHYQDLLYISNDSGATWQQLQISDLKHVDKIFYKDVQNGYIICSKINHQNKVLTITNNGGQTWNDYDLPPLGYNEVILNIEFLDNNTGYINTSEKLYKTNDGGQNWNLIYQYQTCNDSFIINEQLVWNISCHTTANISGSLTVIQKYDNGNLTENQIVNFCGIKIAFPTENTGYILGYGSLYKNNNGINNIKSYQNIFSIYPNPNKGIFNIKFDKNQSQNWQYQITNLQGQILINKQQLIDNKIDASRLPAGVYLLNLQNDERIYTQKIIIQK